MRAKKTSKQPSYICKVMAIFTLFVFTLSNVFETLPLAYAQSPHTYSKELPRGALSPQDSHSLKAFRITPETMAELSLPNHFATIEESFKGTDDRVVILVQDAHAIGEAQQSIRKIISHFHAEHEVDLVHVEGASDKFDATLFRTFPNQEVLANVFDHYVESGEISGATAASVLLNAGIEYVGVEDHDVYENQINAFLEADQNRAQLMSDLKQLRLNLHTLKKKYYSAELFELDQKHQRFESETLDLLKFVSYLNANHSSAPSQKAYPNLSALFAELDHQEGALGHDIALEIKTAAILLESTIQNTETLREFHENFQAYQTEAISAGAFASFLEKIAIAKDATFSLSKGVKGLIKQQQRLEQMSGKVLFEELGAYVKDLKKELFKSREERTLDHLSTYFGWAKKLFELKLLHDQWESLQALKLGDLKGLEAQAARFYKEARAFLSNEVQNDNAFQRFYKIAKMREDIFAENLLYSMKKRAKKTSMLIAGGFHTEGMASRLKKKGISFVVLTPAIESLSKDNRYAEFMRGEVSWKTYFQPENGRINLYDAFSRATIKRLLLSFETPTDRQGSGMVLKKWRDELIHYLNAKKKIEQARRYTRFIDQEAYHGSDAFEEHKQKWLSKVKEFTDNLRFLKKEDRLTPDKILQLSTRPAALHWVAQALAVNRRGYPASWRYGSVSSRQPRTVRSEIRTDPALDDLVALNERIVASDQVSDKELRKTTYVGLVKEAFSTLSNNLLSELPGHWDLLKAVSLSLAEPELAQHARFLPIPVLRSLSEDQWEQLASDNHVVQLLIEEKKKYDDYMQREETWVTRNRPDLAKKKIAYFSAEYGLHGPYIYGGGLGILSGDHLRGASDIGFNFVGIGLYYKKGYFRQLMTPDGQQLEDPEYQGINKEDLPGEEVVWPAGNGAKTGSSMILAIPLPGHPEPVYAKVVRLMQGKAELILLDTDLPENKPEFRDITDKLYRAGSGHPERMEQYHVLGVGGMMALHALGIDPGIIHLNDGHPFLGAVQAIKLRMQDLETEDATLSSEERFEVAFEEVRAKTVFTTHTPVPAGNELFGNQTALDFFTALFEGDSYPVNRLMSMGLVDGPGSDFNVPAFSQRLSSKHNAVSKLHGEVARGMWKRLYPGQKEAPIRGIVNSVHNGYGEPIDGYWQSNEIRDLFKEGLSQERVQEIIEQRDLTALGEVLGSEDWVDDATKVDNDDLWQAHIAKKKQLFEFIKRRFLERRLDSKGRLSPLDQETLSYIESFDPEALTIGFARRFIEYKRALLILNDTERLERIVRQTGKPLQFVFAGKAHPKDKDGQAIIKELHDIMWRLRRQGSPIKIIFIEEYNIETARLLESGVDVWLNTPIRPREASGTSGMKAAMNGVLNLSTKDGWVVEGIFHEVNGWLFGVDGLERDDFADSEALYQVLEQSVIPRYQDRRTWVQMMKASILASTYMFGMERMLAEYADHIYQPALDHSTKEISKAPGSSTEHARRRIANREKIIGAFSDKQTKPIVRIESAYPRNVYTGESQTVHLHVDLKDLSFNDLGLDLKIRKKGKDKAGKSFEWQWIGLDDAELIELGDGRYIVKAELNIPAQGTYELGARLSPRDQSSWHSPEELESVTLTSEVSEPIVASHKSLVEFRARDTEESGQLFYVQLHESIKADSVYWTSQDVDWDSKGYALTHLGDGLWAVVVPANVATPGYYEHRFVVVLDDGREVPVTGDYIPVERDGIKNASITLDENHWSYSKQGAQNILDAPKRDAKAGQLEYVWRNIEAAEAKLEPHDEKPTFQKATVKVELPHGSLENIKNWNFYVHWGFNNGESQHWPLAQSIEMRVESYQGNYHLTARFDVPIDADTPEFKLVAAPRDVQVLEHFAHEWDTQVYWSGEPYENHAFEGHQTELPESGQTKGDARDKYEIIKEEVLKQNLGARRTASILTGLFSLRRTDSDKDLGIGDIKALRDLLEWANEQGLSGVEILPIHETGPTWLWPYSAMSAFAVSHVYADVFDMQDIAASERAQSMLADRDADIQRWRAAKNVQYQDIWQFKLELFQEAFKQFKQDTASGQQVGRVQDFERFKAEKADWLDDWAMYFAVQQRNKYEAYGMPQWAAPFARDIGDKLTWEEQNWSEEYQTLASRHPDAIRRWSEDPELAEEMEFVRYMQWVMYRQVEGAKNHGEDLNQTLIGDIPQYTDFKSAETWVNQHELNFEELSGVDGDPYNEDGQFWMNATYGWQDNWKRVGNHSVQVRRHLKGTPKVVGSDGASLLPASSDWHQRKHDNYTWWRGRALTAAELYHSARDDHSTGKISPWYIHKHAAKAKDGFYQTGPRHEFFQTMQQPFSAGNFLFFAEDLSPVAAEIEPFLQPHGMMTYRFFQFGIGEDASDEAIARYAHPEDYPRHTITLPGTHDAPTLRHWWNTKFWGEHNEDGSVKTEPDHTAIQYILDQLYGVGEKDADDFDELDPETHKRFIRWILKAKSLMAIVPLHDVFYLGKEAEINQKPGEVTPLNWSVRYDFALGKSSETQYGDDLIQQKAHEFAEIIRETNRHDETALQDEGLLLGVTPVIDEDIQAEQWRQPGEPFDVFAVVKSDAKQVQLVTNMPEVESNVPVTKEDSAFEDGKVSALEMHKVHELADGTVIYGLKLSSDYEGTWNFTVRASEEVEPNADDWEYISPNPGDDGRLIVTQNAFPLEDGAGAVSRSEVRRQSWVEANTPDLKKYTVVTRQMEQGDHKGLVKILKEKSKQYAKYLFQLNLTGGLGALMHDAVEAWGRIFGKPDSGPADVISILPLFDQIKQQGLVDGLDGTERFADEYIKGLDDTGISFKFRLRTHRAFAEAAASVGSQATEILDKDLEVKVYQTKTWYAETPVYYMDIQYTGPNGNPKRLFDSIYPDENRRGLNLWRDVHMAAYGDASQLLLLELQKRDLVKKDIIFVDNEVFVSLPTPYFPNAIHDHRNHTVFRPGLYKPHVVSYELLGFPQNKRRYIVNEFGWIETTEAVAMDADFITGVGLAEHHDVLMDLIFPGYAQKLWHFNQDGMRNTNGVFFDKWQAEERRVLIDKMKGRLGLSEDTTDYEFYQKLEQHADMFGEFKLKNEAISAAYVGELLVWLAEEQNNDLWLKDTMKKYQQATGAEQKDDAATVDEFKALLKLFRERIAETATSEDPWVSLLSEDRFVKLREALMLDPIVANIRRQVAYKGPEKWDELFSFLENVDAQDAQRWNEILDDLDGNREMVEFFRNNVGRVILGGRLFHQGGRDLFEQIKMKVNRLGLQDRIVAIENYNIDNAGLIFKAVSGTVMLADEFLEASATSMMKGVTNGAALIGVWGGAMPELFTIVDRDGKERDVFTENLTHDQVVRKVYPTIKQTHGDDEVSVLDLDPADLKHRLQSTDWEWKEPEWRITNGWLVYYSNYGVGPGLEKSSQDGGERRPAAQSLLQALRGLNANYQQADSRQALQFDVLKSSYKVDMERSQARAQAFLWQRAHEARVRDNEVIGSIDADKQQAADAAKTILSDKEKGFVWERKPNPAEKKTVVAQESEPGLLGFLDAMRALRYHSHQIQSRLSEPQHVRGIELIWSLSHHTENLSMDDSNDFGGVINYLLNDVFKNDMPAMQSVRSRLIELGQAVRNSPQGPERVYHTLLALDLAEKVAERLVFLAFETFADGDQSAGQIFSPQQDPDFLAREALQLSVEKRSLMYPGVEVENVQARRALVAKIEKRRQILEAFRSKNGPYVKVERTEATAVAKDQGFHVHGLLDLKNLDAEDVRIEVFFRDKNAAEDAWQSFDASDDLEHLGGTKYRINAEVQLPKTGHYEYKFKISPRDQSVWYSQDIVDQATSESYAPQTIHAYDQDLLNFRADSPKEQGMLFHIRIPNEDKAKKVYWASERTGWETNAVEMKRSSWDPETWVVVIDAELAPAGYHEFIFKVDVEEQDDPKWLTGHYGTVTASGAKRARIQFDDKHFGFSQERANQMLETIQEQPQDESGRPLLELVMQDVESEGGTPPVGVTRVEQATIVANIPNNAVPNGQWNFYIHWGYADEPGAWQTTRLDVSDANAMLKLTADIEVLPYAGTLKYKLVAAPPSKDLTKMPVGEWNDSVLWSGGTDYQVAVLDGPTPQRPVDTTQARAVAWRVFKDYINGRKKALEAFQDPQKGPLLRTYLKDYLEEAPFAESLNPTTRAKLLAYAVPISELDSTDTTERKVMILLDMGIDTSVIPDGKARGVIDVRGARILFGETSMQQNDQEFQSVDLYQESSALPAQGQGRYRRFGVRRVKDEGINFAISSPERVRALRFDPIKQEHQDLVRLFVSATNENVTFIDETKTPEEVIIEKIKERFTTDQAPAKPVNAAEKIRKAGVLLKPLAELSASGARDSFGEDALPGIIGFLAAIEPKFLEDDEGANLREWNPEAFDRIKEIVKEGELADLFRLGDIEFHPTDDRRAILFSKTHKGRRIFMPFTLAGIDPNEDGKAFFTATEYNELGLDLSDGKTYQVWDHIIEDRYRRNRHNQRSFKRNGGWAIKVPIRRQGWHKPNVRQEGWRFQFLEFVEAEEELPGTAEHKHDGLALSVNLQDLGVEFVEKEADPDDENAELELKVVDPLAKLEELIDFIASKGFGEIYLYGGLWQKSRASVDVHTGEHADPDPKNAVPYEYQTSDTARIRIRVGNYTTKKKTVMIDGKKAVIDDRLGNPFSVVIDKDGKPRPALNPELSREDAEAAVRSLIEKAHARGLKVRGDFIPWLAPENINETNYHWTMHKELEPDELLKFRKKRTESEKTAYLDVLSEEKYTDSFPLRIGEGDTERVIFIRHVVGQGANVDQAMPNPFVQDVRDYYDNYLQYMVDLGFDGVRADLAHYLLNRSPELRGLIDGGWGGEIKPGTPFEDDNEIWAHIIGSTTHYAVTKHKRNFHFSMEVYPFYGEDTQDNHLRLFQLGKPKDEGGHASFVEEEQPSSAPKNAVSVYFKKVFDRYFDLMKNGGGRNSYELEKELYHAFAAAGRMLDGEHPDPMLFASNFDEIRIKYLIDLANESRRGEHSMGILALLFAVANTGTRTMVDLSDLVPSTGPIATISGGQINKDTRQPNLHADSAHAWATNFEIRLRSTWEKYKNLILNGEGFQVLDQFHKAITRTGQQFFKFMDQGRQDNVSVLVFQERALNEDDKTGKWVIVAVNHEPSQTKDISFPLPSAAFRDAQQVNELTAIDVERAKSKFGEDLTINDQWQITGVRLTPDEPYKIIRVSMPDADARSEVRNDQSPRTLLRVDRAQSSVVSESMQKRMGVLMTKKQHTRNLRTLMAAVILTVFLAFLISFTKAHAILKLSALAASVLAIYGLWVAFRDRDRRLSTEQERVMFARITGEAKEGAELLQTLQSLDNFLTTESSAEEAGLTVKKLDHLIRVVEDADPLARIQDPELVAQGDLVVAFEIPGTGRQGLGLKELNTVLGEEQTNRVIKRVQQIVGEYIGLEFDIPYHRLYSTYKENVFVIKASDAGEAPAEPYGDKLARVQKRLKERISGQLRKDPIIRAALERKKEYLQRKRIDIDGSAENLFDIHFGSAVVQEESDEGRLFADIHAHQALVIAGSLGQTGLNFQTQADYEEKYWEAISTMFELRKRLLSEQTTIFTGDSKRLFLKPQAVTALRKGLAWDDLSVEEKKVFVDREGTERKAHYEMALQYFSALKVQDYIKKWPVEYQEASQQAEENRTALDQLAELRVALDTNGAVGFQKEVLEAGFPTVQKVVTTDVRNAAALSSQVFHARAARVENPVYATLDVVGLGLLNVESFEDELQNIGYGTEANVSEETPKKGEAIGVGSRVREIQRTAADKVTRQRNLILDQVEAVLREIYREQGASFPEEPLIVQMGGDEVKLVLDGDVINGDVYNDFLFRLRQKIRQNASLDVRIGGSLLAKRFRKRFKKRPDTNILAHARILSLDARNIELLKQREKLESAGKLDPQFHDAVIYDGERTLMPKWVGLTRRQDEPFYEFNAPHVFRLAEFNRRVNARIPKRAFRSEIRLQPTTTVTDVVPVERPQPQLVLQREQIAVRAQNVLHTLVNRGGVLVSQALDLVALEPQAFAQVLDAMDDQAPVYASRYYERQVTPPQTSSLDAFLETQQHLTAFTPLSLDGIEKAIETHLANSANQFHFNAVMPFSTNELIQNWWLGFFAKIEGLKSRYGNRVQANVRFLSDADEIAEWSGFVQTLERSESAKVLDAAERATFRKIISFMDLNQNALAFALPDKWDRQLSRARSGRVVRLDDIVWSEAFPVSTLLGFGAALELDITSERLLWQVQRVAGPEAIGFDRGSFVIHKGARNIVLEAAAYELLATMA